MNWADKITSWYIDRLSFAKGRLEQTAPRHIRSEVLDSDSLSDMFENFDDRQLQKVAVAMGWIYSDLELLARQVFPPPLQVYRKTSEKEILVPNHEWENLIENPNDMMSKSFLLTYITYWLSLSRRGAFIFMAPYKDDKTKIAELWPIDSGLIKPVKDKNHYVKKFKYTPERGGESFYIDARYVIWLRYPDPHDYWASLPPLIALIESMKIERGITAAQEKFYTDSRGVPLSIVSVDPDISPADYESVKADIRKDWQEKGTTIAIARAGTIDIKSLGFTQKDLEIIASQELTRDRIDSVLLGIPFRADGTNNLKESAKFILEWTVYPLHIRIAEQLTTQSLRRFWAENLVARFDDVRAQDRSLKIQQKNVDSAWYTVNEMRRIDGDPPIADIEGMPGYGQLPVRLATNAQFLSGFYGISAQPETPETGTSGVGNLTDQLSPPSTTNLAAAGNEMQERQVKSALSFAETEDLKRWKKIAIRDFSRGESRRFSFESDFIPDSKKVLILSMLGSASNVEMLDRVFT